MTTVRIIVLFLLAAVAEIGGAWLIWQAVRENRGWWFALAGVLALGAYGFVAAFQPDANFGRVLAAYGGVFVAGSLAWGIVVSTGSSPPCGTTSDRPSRCSAPRSSSSPRWPRASTDRRRPRRAPPQLSTAQP